MLAWHSGAEWFVGGIIAGEATRLSTGLGFLPPGNWVAEVYSDGADQKIAFSTRQVTSASVLDLPVAKHGGFTAHLRPAP
ncbi:glycoside hydrolase family 97 C-terminal domain-containing protein [Amycolatopsis sp. 195334CR]|uniref:glycoside hydrolase family 97 C-terminal domain-containing protein n=1 Tax=Amycolatopsis sp. 195334CR TaxID=2814588 RepID=UPI0027DB2573|nr:glycoside hydrolase family 97 C-terminal domain-containing protein [Amycolatopsis sp. 195334CR]